MTPQEILAFAAVYVFWGSTFLFIRFAVETIPPFVMSGGRFVLAGTLLYAVARARGAAPATRRQWRDAAVVGVLLMVLGNGAVVWSERRIASGVAALLVAAAPFWFALIEWLRPGGRRPTLAVTAGLVAGLTGIALLVGPARLGTAPVDPIAALVVLAGTVCWAAGSMYSRHADRPDSPLLGTAMNMLIGGAVLLALAGASGELAAFEPARVTPRSALSVVYLVVFGSLIAFSAYVWLLRVSTPARVATYAYVNPVVAVLLGWLVAGEPLTTRMLAAMAIILGSVALMTRRTAAA